MLLCERDDMNKEEGRKEGIEPANKKSRLNLKNIENFIQVENMVSK